MKMNNIFKNLCLLFILLIFACKEVNNSIVKSVGEVPSTSNNNPSNGSNTTNPVTSTIGTSTVNLVNVPSSNVNTNSISYSFNGTNASLFECKIDSESFSVCLSPKTYSNLSLGTHLFSIRSKDNKNLYSLISEHRVLVDFVPPVAPQIIPNLLSSIINSISLNLSFISTDLNSGIGEYQCSIDNGIYKNCSNPLSLVNLVNGVHSVKVIAIDKALNKSNESVYSFTVDNVAPEIILKSSPANSSTATTSTFEFNIVDSVSGLSSVMCSLDSASFSNCTSPIILSNLAIGSHLFKVQATDKAGNVSLISNNFQVVSATPLISEWNIESSSIDAANFLNPATNLLWKFSNGAEYPGASGSLSFDNLIPEVKINYNLSCSATAEKLRIDSTCGNYVAANLNLETPFMPVGSDKVFLFLQLQDTQSILNPGVRLVDSTGQNFQYMITQKNIEGTGYDVYDAIIDVSKPKIYFGGSADGIIHYPIKSISILATGNPILTSPGILKIKKIKWLSSLSVSVKFGQNTPLVNRNIDTTYQNHLGVAAHFAKPLSTNNLNQAKMAKDVGINIVRMDLNWGAVEINGVFNFSAYIQATEQLQNLGMSVLWILDYGHKDHGDSIYHLPQTENDYQAFATFAQNAAIAFKNYNNIVGFEIWNEPNIAPFWTNPNPVNYTHLLNLAEKSIHEINPKATVINAGLAFVDYLYFDKMLTNLNPAGLDSYAIHPYRGGSAPETFATDYENLKRIAKYHNHNLPIWDSEWGYSSYGNFSADVYGNGNDPRANRYQGILTLRRVLTEMALNVPQYFIYDLIDDGTDPLNKEHHFGILYPNNSPKPAYVGLNTLWSIQSKSNFKGILSGLPIGLHVARFDSTTESIFAIWADQDQISYNLKLPNGILSIKSWDGSVISVTNNLSLKEDSGPLFITMKRVD
jgi:hypothetical protein